MAQSHDYEDEYLTDPGTEEESEDESLFDEGLGDGYVQKENRPRTEFVGASSTTVEAGSKAREANEQRARNSSAAAASHFSVVASSPQSVVWTMPVVDHSSEVPPPTYESATTASSQAHSTQYGSIPTPTASYFAGPGSEGQTQPQSMRDSTRPPSDEESSLLGPSKSQRHSSWRQGILRCFKPLSICNMVLFVAIVVVISLVAGVVSDDYTSGGGDGSGVNNPISPPSSPTPQPQHPSVPSHKSCDLSVVASTLQLDFDKLSNFTFLELMESSTYFHGGIEGQIAIQSASAPQHSDIRVWISYSTSAPWHIQHSDYIQTHDSLTLQVPSVVKVGDDDGHARPCLGAYVRIEIRAGLRLDNWELVTGNFDVQIDDGLFDHEREEQEGAASSHLRITSNSSFTAVRGKISAKYWSSRRTIIETSSGSIRGEFALRDLLSLTSQSGRVNVQVDPKEADSADIRPAEFVVHTSSGSVNAYFPSAGEVLPIRNYRTRVETSSAGVRGSLILGIQTNLHTQSGELDVELLPVIISSVSDRHEDGTEGLISRLYASTSSASQYVVIRPPYHLPGGSSDFASIPTEQKFTTSSGSLELVYPESWAGYIEGSTSSGSIDIRGRHVEFLTGKDGQGKKSWWDMYRHVVARKGKEGEGKGRVRVGTGSGGVRMQMGDA